MLAIPHTWPCKNFTRKELSCPCCGLMVCPDHALISLQQMRDIIRRAMFINSACRCPHYNALVGGAPLSSHKFGHGFDISTFKHNRWKLLEAAKRAGFTGFGFAQTYLHVDKGRARHWYYGEVSKKYGTCN